MASVAYAHEVEVNTAAINEIVAQAAPAIPADLPDEPEAAIPILDGLLIGDVNPELNLLSDSMYRLQRVQKDWADALDKIKNVQAALDAGHRYEETMTDNDVSATLRAGRARNRALHHLKADIEVRLHAKRLELNRAAAPAAAPAPAAAVVAPRHYAPSAPRRFDGKHKEFLQFAQMYENTIGNSGLSNVEKLSRLLGLLDGEPKRLLSGLLVTDGNYAIALDTLRRRYGDTERTARELKTELNSLPTARSTAEVRDLQIKTESLVQQLDSLGHMPASEETMWLLEGKLPRRCLEKLMENKKTTLALAAPHNVWDLTKFRSSLEEIVRDEERIGGIIQPPQPGHSHAAARGAPRAPQGPGARPGRRHFNAAGVVKEGKLPELKKYSPMPPLEGLKAAKQLAKAGTKKFPAKTEIPGCLFCRGKHRAYLCPLSIDERRQKVVDAKGCLKCLQPGHWANNCTAEPCRRCNQNHHTFLCKDSGIRNPNKIPLPQKPRSFPPRSTPLTKATNHMALTEKPTELGNEAEVSKSLVGATTRRRSKALMMCVTATVFNPSTFASAEVPIFIDSGSSESYISKKLAKLLGLNLGPSQLIEISRFGEGRNDVCPMNLLTNSARFCVRGQENETFMVDGLTVDQIIGAITQVPEVDDTVITEYKVTLPTSNKPPQVMLGIAHFAQLKLRFEMELPSGFSLFSSSLGPLLCGKGELVSTTTASAVCMTTISVKEKPEKEDELHESVRRYFLNESCDFSSKKDEK